MAKELWRKFWAVAADDDAPLALLEHPAERLEHATPRSPSRCIRQGRSTRKNP
jgi:hypothetical protein